MDGAYLALFIDEGPVVAAEAGELAESVSEPSGGMLKAATKRIEVGLGDPRSDPDEVYNQLLRAFDVACTLPGAVGLDPYDGEVYPSPSGREG